MSLQWYDQPENVGALIRWLGDRGETVGWTPDQYARLVEKPWKWTPEWNDMVRWERGMGMVA